MQHLLDRLGVIHGTDKTSLRWDYLRHYQEHLSDWRDREFYLLEIGVAGGNSLLTWLRFFSQATVVGIDIATTALRCAGERTRIEIGSQEDVAFLDTVCDKYPPSIIIDDGSHQADHILTSFRHLFPRLAPGGWYIIEDMNITGNQDKVAVTPHEMVGRIAIALLYRKDDGQKLGSTFEWIDRVDCARGIVFIRKRDEASETAQVLGLTNTVQNTTYPNNYLWLSEKLIDIPDRAELAETCSRRAVDLHSQHAIYHIALSRTLQRRQKWDEAIFSAQAACSAEPQNFEAYYQHAAALLASGQKTVADEVFIQAVAVAPQFLRVHIADRWRALGQVVPEGCIA